MLWWNWLCRNTIHVLDSFIHFHMFFVLLLFPIPFWTKRATSTVLQRLQEARRRRDYCMIYPFGEHHGEIINFPSNILSHWNRLLDLVGRIYSTLTSSSCLTINRNKNYTKEAYTKRSEDDNLNRWKTCHHGMQKQRQQQQQQYYGHPW